MALTWIAWHFAGHDSRVYSSGRLANSHAVFETQCTACHVRETGAYSAEAENSACLACHDGPIHHEFDKPMDCSDCHMEHRGRINLSAVKNEGCALCHDRLARRDWGHVIDFEEHHPEFSSMRPVDGKSPRDPGTIKLNHLLHMKPIRRSANGPNVQLVCGDCHRPTAAANYPWPYADAKYTAASVSYTDADNFRAAGTQGLARHNPPTGRELMAPVKFANACAACHLLTFDKRFDEGVPHDKPEVVHAFLVKEFSAYIAAHSNELHEMQDPARDLTGKPSPPRTRTLTPSQWIEEKVAVAEELLARKTCAQCHQMNLQSLPDTGIARWATRQASTEQTSKAQMRPSELPPIKMMPIPMVAPANTTLRWLPHSKFDHEAHTGFTCTSCHEKALTSKESSDILIPGIATCQTCHAPGPNHAESRCFECHTYHDWSKRKEVTPTFTLPALHTGR